MEPVVVNLVGPEAVDEVVDFRDVGTVPDGLGVATVMLGCLAAGVEADFADIGVVLVPAVVTFTG